MSSGYLCRACSKVVGATKNSRYRSHKNAEGVNCEMSSVEIPDDLLQQPPSDTKNAGVPEEGKDFAKCPQCGRNVKLTRLGYFPPHQTTLYGGQQCSTTGVRAFHAGKTTDLPLPGDTIPEKGVNRALAPKVSNQKEYEQAKPEGVPLALPPGESSPSASSKKSAAASSLSPTGTPPDDSPPSEEEALEALKVFDEPARSNLIQQPMALTEEILARWSEVEAQMSALRAAASGASTGTSSPESVTTSTDSPPPALASTGSSGPGSRILQPDYPVRQPRLYEGPEKPQPMGDLARELSTRIDELFYAYNNRKSSDNRSAQTTLGPSEIGTPCDRRLAMALMGVPPVNEGGDGWAAFVGTCGHEGMAEVLRFADAGTGRFAVEMSLALPSLYVPRGTSDALDRRDGTVIDWKFMGDYSLKKFKLEGPSDTYRVQAHTYGLGMSLAGEVVRNVAIVGLPRAGGSLKDKHVWTERFDRKVGEAALKRVERIAKEVESIRMATGALAVDTLADQMRAAQTFETKNDCRWCPFFLKGDKEMRRGCPGV